MKVLIAYYSRTGVTKIAASAIADQLYQSDVEVVIEEVVDTKNRNGLLGYLRAGMDALLKRETVIAPTAADPGEFDLLVVGTPVWAFTLATPMRTYCRTRCGAVRQLAMFCTMGGSGDRRTFRAAEQLCGKPLAATLALIDKRVKQRDEEQFIAKVRRFATQIAALQETTEG